METIILKIILCSGIVLGLYYLFLAKEKTLTFNRFYLLLGLIFSYTIPFISIETRQIETEKQALVFEQEIPQQILQTPIAKQAETFDYTQLLLIIYFAVSGILIAKMLYSIIRIKTLKGRKIVYQNRNVVLLKNKIAPFSFLSTIYLSEKYFKDGKIDERIFLHEEIHVKQKHSLDVLFIEVIKAFSWFNPFIYFYKNVMITNHEFIADEEVIIKNENIKNYQELILNEVLKQQNLQLIHQFNFNNTKKRFIMMTKRNSKFAEAKKYLAIPAFAGLALIFAERVYANDNVTIDNYLSLTQPSKVNKTYSSDAIKEFLEITNKYQEIIKDRDFDRFKKEVPRIEQLKLIELRKKIDVQDWDKLPILVSYNEIQKQIPTQKQLNQFLNSKYNITLNGEVVDNNTLKNYKNTDFYSIYILKVLPKNPDFGKFEYSVTLYTTAYAKDFNRQKNIVVSFILSSDEFHNELKNDTISPRKTVNVKLNEVKNNSDKSQKTVLNISSAVEGKAADLIPAEFPGGANQLRNIVSGNFNGSVLNGNESSLKSVITFIVDENGKVRDIKTFGDNEKFNNEAYRATKLANENVIWKPATLDGKAVAFQYKIPLSMTFETFNKTQ